MDWTEIAVTVSANDIDSASNIALMTVPYGIYIEDYRNLEQEAKEISRIDLIDENLLSKDRSKGIVRVYISPDENPAEAISFLKQRLEFNNIVYTIEIKPCKNEDWENNWKRYFKSFPVGKNLFIHPVWEENFNALGRKIIHIEPGLSFGTGGHSTTRLCLEAIEDFLQYGMRVLDIGCGSGILSIAALLLGASSALGVDIDKYAVRTAVQNGETNELTEPRYKIICGNLADNISGKFDLITANIAADAIISFCGQVQKHLADGGVFIASGIIESREDEVLFEFAKFGFKV
ncbi:MAG: 50S ribosomal protein L11 methyltransferase, partial [Oscillospiraceae bacterium]|nr:50S ribosomal protein L11 methyltransferase [Oscillospiraceae bacterium]